MATQFNPISVLVNVTVSKILEMEPKKWFSYDWEKRKKKVIMTKVCPKKYLPITREEDTRANHHNIEISKRCFVHTEIKNERPLLVKSKRKHIHMHVSAFHIQDSSVHALLDRFKSVFRLYIQNVWPLTRR